MTQLRFSPSQGVKKPSHFTSCRILLKRPHLLVNLFSKSISLRPSSTSNQDEQARCHTSSACVSRSRVRSSITLFYPPSELIQSTANAILVFPDATSQYVSCYTGAGISAVGTDTFEICVRNVGEDCRYQAVHLYKASNEVVADGSVVWSNTIYGTEPALKSLLKVLIDIATKRFANGDGVNGVALSEAPWVHPELK